MEFTIETPYIKDVKRNTSGVYFVLNRITNKCYVGSSVDIHRRMKEHRSGKGSGLLARSVHKYGKENFEFFLLEICEGRKANEETRKKLSDARKGRAPWNKGIKNSEEHNRKISEGLKRRVLK